ncbi:Protein of unknown function DUF58 [Ruminococcaceae bacterium FB2012]|nr:Protein of unknown function DUF58 [Ruminococcaceae bacterium FB2012]
MIVVYSILLLVSLLFYIQFEGAFSFYLFCFVAAYPVIFGILTYIVKKKLRVGFDCADKTALRGNSVPINLIIDNDSSLPVPNCEITLRYSTEFGIQTETVKIHTPVFPKNSQVLTVRISYKHYGTLNIEIAKVRIFDILRIIRRRIKLRSASSNTSIVIFPDHIPIANRINDYSESGLESETYSKTKKGDDASEIFDIHTYNEGDKISRIHWKLSAKQDEMMVKDYSLPTTNGILLVIDFSGLTSDHAVLDRMDTLIDAIAAISMHLAEYETAHSILWCARNADGYEKRQVTDLESYTETMGALIGGGLRTARSSPAEVISEQSSGSARYAHIIYCTNGFDDRIRSMLTGSGYGYRYTVLDTAADNSRGYTDGNLSYIPLPINAVAESLENIAI